MYRSARVKSKAAIEGDTLLMRGFSGAEDGFAVAMVLFIIIIISLLGVAMLTVAAYQMRDADRTLPSNRAYDLADSGLSYAHAYLSQGNPVPDPTDDPDHYDSGSVEMGGADSTFDVKIYLATDSGDKVMPYQYRIESTGSYRENEGSASRTYNRKLEEVISFRGTLGNFDAFNYCMYSDKGDVTLDTGTTADDATGSLIVDGDIYAGRDVYLIDQKADRAAGSLTVNGDVFAGQDFVALPESNNMSTANDSVSGNVTAGRDVTIAAKSNIDWYDEGANFTLGGSINSGGNVSLTNYSYGGVIANVKVAQNANTSVNAKGNVNIENYCAAVCFTHVCVGNEGAASDINADGDVRLWGKSVWLAIPWVTVYGSIYAKGATRLVSIPIAVGKSGAWVDVYGDVKNNGFAKLSAVGEGGWGPPPQYVWVHGMWQHPPGCLMEGNVFFGEHLNVNPNVGDAPVQGLPYVEMPEPDWDWFRTAAIAQGRYYTGDQTFTNVDINYDPSSLWVMYVAGDVTITNVNQDNINVNCAIVCEGDFKVTGAVNMTEGSKYQVIGRGNISHANSGSTEEYVSDTIFLYTDGSYDSDGDGWSGDVTFDLAWFDDVKGQIAAKGNISAPMDTYAEKSKVRISQFSPILPAGGWLIPVDVLRFREL